ncbi:MAG: hypothetical protein JWL93_1900 [Hyphomicrobiales bacterium]|nr:hypothetical protein [Hyphomicrobiales bacterium]
MFIKTTGLRCCLSDLGAAIRLSIASGAALAAMTATSLAHPHVFVVVKSEVLFDPQGRVSGVAHSWTFDEMYSAFATTGLSADGKPATDAQLAPIAETNVGDLEEFGYFTVVKAAGQKIEFGKPTDIAMSEGKDKLVTLRFKLPLKQPASAGKALTLQVYDPSYFVSFDFEKTDAVKLVSAPAGCSLNVAQPNPLQEAESKKLSEAFFSGLSPGNDFGVKLASRAVVACP